MPESMKCFALIFSCALFFYAGFLIGGDSKKTNSFISTTSGRIFISGPAKNCFTINNGTGASHVFSIGIDCRRASIWMVDENLKFLGPYEWEFNYNVENLED